MRVGHPLCEHVDYGKSADLLASAAGRALGSVINRVKTNKDLGYNMFTTLVDSCMDHHDHNKLLLTYLMEYEGLSFCDR